jgi:hypothetical protein
MRGVGPVTSETGVKEQDLAAELEYRNAPPGRREAFVRDHCGRRPALCFAEVQRPPRRSSGRRAGSSGQVSLIEALSPQLEDANRGIWP